MNEFRSFPFIKGFLPARKVYLHVVRCCTFINGMSFLSGSHQNRFEYLAEHFHTGVGYSSVNTARSVLSTIIKTENWIPFGEFPLVCTSFKAVFNLRPALPKFSPTWDVSIVLKCMKSFQALKQCYLKSVLYHLAIFLCITTSF